MQKNILKKAIPNGLTIFRCISAVLLPLIIIYGGNNGAIISVPLLLLAGLSDYFDGFYARKYNVLSNFGKIIIRVLLLIDLPSAVSLLSSALYSPRPAAINLLGSTP